MGDEASSTTRQAAPQKPSLAAFLAGELRAYLLRFLKTTLAVAGALSGAFGVYVGWVAFTSDGPSASDSPLLAALLAGLLYAAMALPATSTVGAVVGGAAVLWRAAGAAAFVPLVAAPLGARLALRLGVPILREDVADLGAAIRAAFDAKGLPYTEAALGAGRVAHAGGPAALLVLVILLPFVLLDAMVVFFTPGVLWAAFVLLATAAALGLFGALVLGGPALAVAAWAFVARTRRRWREAVEAAGAPPPSTGEEGA